MKRTFVCLNIILVFCSLLSAQLPADDPLAESYIIHNGSGDELITVQGNYSSIEVNIYKYYRAYELYSRDTLLHCQSWTEQSNCYFFDMDIYDFDNDELSEILTVWISGQQVEIALLEPDPARLTIDSTGAWSRIERLAKTTPAPITTNMWDLAGGVFVKSGNFDSDSLGEFVVAYWAEDGKIELAVYDVSDSLDITELATIRDQEITAPPEIDLCEDDIYLYDIECVDFNGDGLDEIMLSGRVAYEPGGWQIFTNIYTYDESENLLKANIKKPIYTQTNPAYDIANFNTAAGKFAAEDKEHAVVSLLQYVPERTGADTLAYMLIPVDVSNQLNILNIGATVYQFQDTLATVPCYFRSSTLTAADVNNDGIDELLSAFSFQGERPTFKIYQSNIELDFSVWADLDNLKEEFQSVIACGNFSRDTLEETRFKEIIVQSGSWYPGYNTEIYQLQYQPDGSFDKLELQCKGEQIQMSKTEPWLAGNLDGDIRLGKPKRYAVTEILQPLVILNAPPIHFDVFDGEYYDICRSYNENDGLFVAKYIKESEQSTEVQTEINRDWSMSTTLSGEFSFWGLSVSSHLTQKYGKKFSKVDGSSRTVTVGFEVSATVDDQIYATVMNYDLWEYPVYGNNKLQGHVLVVEPQIVRNSWFDSKSWKGYSYIPNHEVGNILSYRRYPMLSANPLLAEKIKGDYGLDTSFLLSGNSSYNWYLNFQDFTESQASTTTEYSRDWGVSVSYWGSGFSMSGSYNSEDIQIQRTTVESGIYLHVHLDAVDMSKGETRYEVTPYAYWANNGALVVDYAVDPEIALPGGEDTWWDTHYGYFPDPAFILPWRYDPEKGDEITESKRYQTKDILFRPQDPREGDIVTIYNRIHNFSLLPTPGPVGVRFYVGHPDSGGILIENESGQSEFFTDGIIPPRGTTEIEMQWKVMQGIGTFPRIYAVIDEDDMLKEIHENNNMSWNILQKSTTGTNTENISGKIPGGFRLMQNYPNPFNPVTTIEYQIAYTGQVELSIFNILGQKITTLVDKKQLAGSYKLNWDVRNLPSGIYYYRLVAGGYREVKKMVLVK